MTYFSNYSYYDRIGDMGEFSTVMAIKSVLESQATRSTLEKQGSICIRGIKLEHLKEKLCQLPNIDFGKVKDAEMDIITIKCRKDKVDILFGESKVK